MEKRFAVIDLETTGHSPLKGDKIIEVGLVIIENDKIIDEFSTLLNPGKDISPFITKLTGISNHEVADAPLFKDQAGKIAELLQNSYIIAHNVPFDLGFINEEFAFAGLKKLQNPVLDTVELSRILCPKAPGFKLGQLAEYLKLDHHDPHRALSDAFVTAELFLALRKKLYSLPYETITHLMQLTERLKSDLYEMLYDCQQSFGLSIESEAGISSFRGLAFKSVEIQKKNHPDISTPFGNYLDDIYEENGSMQKNMSRYEKRNGQRNMSETVYDAFQSKNHALIEAETGTGKSIAYLIPAVYEAVRSKKRIVISTYTTQLQSQLLDEEIPLIRKLLSFPFQVALLKGKQHYISLEKFERALADTQSDNYDIVLTKSMILVWLTETDTGDIDEIQLPSSGYFFYRRISSDTEGFADPKSPWFSRSYYQKARKKAQQADILITNHALFSTDMFNDYQFLPSYNKAIIDEAHHMEETASKHYGLKLDYVSVQYLLSHIGAADEDGWLNKILTKYRFTEENFASDTWNNIFMKAKHEADDVFRMIFQYVIEQKQTDRSLSDIGRVQYRFQYGEEHSSKWDVIIEMISRFIFYLRDLIHMLSQLNYHVSKSEQLDRNDINNLVDSIESLQSVIDRTEQLFLVEDEQNAQVKWIEIDAHGAKNAVYLYSEPTDMSGIMANEFFSQKESVVLTSATLTMKNSFSFVQNRLGLTSENTIPVRIESPFSYQDQVQLMIPDDFPDIRRGSQDDFIYSTCEAIISLARITQGRMLVLFTSYEMLRKSYRLLKDTMDTSDYMLIAQGISSGSRSRLKKNFQTFDQSILLGTSSFWEGVDIPGDDLSCLMIVRLPFQPPNHPIYEAKSQRLKDNGKNAFFDLALPNAVIRFKQGFGRLIRSASDRGIVFICDARIVKSRYGKFFTQSIPSVPMAFDSTEKLMDKAEKWF